MKSLSFKALALLSATLASAKWNETVTLDTTSTLTVDCDESSAAAVATSTVVVDCDETSVPVITLTSAAAESTTLLTTTVVKTVVVKKPVTTVYPEGSTGVYTSECDETITSYETLTTVVPCETSEPVVATTTAASAVVSASASADCVCPPNPKITPKVVVISMFSPEQNVWLENMEFTHNVSTPGLSPLFPHIHCTEDYDVCQITTGESEINAASTIMAFALSPKFDLTKTYFLIAGIAGVNPHVGTLGSVFFARYAVQVALQYEVDSRQMPANWTTGYYGYDTTAPGQYPEEFYGTEVLELNAKLRDRAVSVASQKTLNDSATAIKFRANYDFAPANQPPAVAAGDSLTSDVYFFGSLLGEAFGNWTELITNGTGVYATTAQEDNATLEALMRAANHTLVDYSRIMCMRTCSDIDRAPPTYDGDEVDFFNNASQGGFTPSIANIFIAGKAVVDDILENWDSIYYSMTDEVAPENYLGDVFGTLGGTPDFGPSSE